MNFPLITWSDLVGPVTVNGTIPPGDPGTAQQRYGFGISNTTTKEGDADTVAGYLKDAVNAGLGLGAVTQARYVYNDGPGPSNSPLGIRWNNVTASSITIGFGTVAMANKFGFATTTVTIPPAPPSALGYIDTTINPGMFWGPGGLAGDVRRMLTQRAASSSSDMSGLSTDVVNWGAVADLEMLSTIFPAANYTRWWAAIQIYANAANRLVTDPNNTLEGLIEAASEGKTFRLYREPATTAGIVPSTYQVCRMPGVSNKGSAEDFVTAADEPRLWSTAGLIFRGET
jgi:hypothetical protein